MQITHHPDKTTCKVVTFPVYPHVKKFIYGFYGIPEGQEIQLEHHTSLHVAMTACIRGKQRKHTARDESSGTERFTDSISIVLTSSLSRLTLTNPIIVRFSNEFDKIFKEAFYQWVTAQDKVGINNSEAIRSFMREYSLTEDDYSLENFRRLWLRFREYRKKLSLLPKN